MNYKAPTNLFNYLIKHGTDLGSILGSETYADVNFELLNDIILGAATFSEQELAPLNRSGDLNPAKIEQGEVKTSPGFKEAYQSFVEMGWLGLSMSEEIGGMGLPQTVSVITNEMIYAANMAFGLCPMLTASAAKAIEAHAGDELKEVYLPKMVNGEWSGAMNLTEPSAGSDLGVLRAKAEPNADGSYALSGQKIFITWGDHDCAENIIHLVLARLPDAPSGSKGISLFLCPKRLVNPDGSLGEINKVKAISLEHKLGIHGSPTCVMEFDSAKAWLIGRPNEGLKCMFTMMNEARLFVGVQGVAIGERAYQDALEFSKERIQGRVINSPGVNATIIGHPDIRRNLLTIKSRLLGARMICLATAFASDAANCLQDISAKQTAHKKEALLTPIAKSYGSDIGVQASSDALQIFGGMGYVEETGAAQHYRDARIAPIYEGTNGIQAIDLVQRKIRYDGGDAVGGLLSELKGIALKSDKLSSRLKELGNKLRSGIADLESATAHILNASELDVLAAATPYLNLAGDVISNAFLLNAVVNGIVAEDPLADIMFELVSVHSATTLARSHSYLASINFEGADLFKIPVEQLSDL